MGIFGSFNANTGTTGPGPGFTVIEDFCSNGTWSKCPGATYVEIITIGGGGGGGNGLTPPPSSCVCGAVVLGGAGGGGGGISQQIFKACSLENTACVIVGGGGGISSAQAGSGGVSKVCDPGVEDYVCAAGGKGGYGGADLYPTYGAFPSPSFSNGGTPCQGGAGNYADGNDGGQAFYRCSPFTVNALSPTNCTSPSTTRAGGAGGSTMHLICSGAASAPSTAQTVLGIDLTNIGNGGNGGNSRFDFSTTNGTPGGAGRVRIIQTF